MIDRNLPPPPPPKPEPLQSGVRLEREVFPEPETLILFCIPMVVLVVLLILEVLK